LKPEDVPSGPLVLDTDAFSFVSDRSTVGDPFRALVLGHELLLTFVTVGEALQGALSKGWGPDKMNGLESRLRSYGIIGGSIDAARQYAELARRLRDQVPYNDLWIAACALGQDPPLPLVSNDKHMLAIADSSGLVVVRPDSPRPAEN
jgi:predicted nucleic acid-binding protein